MPHGIGKLISEGSIDNFRRLIGESEQPFRGPVFVDSDTYKVLEGIAWELGHAEDESLRAFYDETVELLERVQQPDGYLNSAYQREDREVEPWADFAQGHELYCVGHLVQAGIASKRALGEDRLLAVARRAADLVVERFGGPTSRKYPGHPEIEYALIELYRLTGEESYLSTAEAFLERRGSGELGHGVFGSSYYQDETPVRKTAIMRGHAVRALYLNSGVTDLYLEKGDAELLEVMRAQWNDMESHRSYITGGTGARHRDESFGDSYELPSERSYSESCAGIAVMHWGWRMYLATGEARYADVFETALYNVFASSTSADGEAFFYSNPLQRRPDHGVTQEEASGNRLSWFYCACCPPNIMRTFASIESYLVAKTESELQIAQYTAAHVDTELVGGQLVLDIETAYPAEGLVRIVVTEAPAGGASLALRVPAWCERYGLTVDGQAVDAAAEDGWLHLDGVLVPGAAITLELDQSPVLLAAHPRVDAVRGAVALRRGPVVYCLQQSDNAIDVDSVYLTGTGVAETEGGFTGLGPGLTAEVLVDTRANDEIPLYAPLVSLASPGVSEGRVTFRPYASWGDEDSVGAMRVWTPLSMGS